MAKCNNQFKAGMTTTESSPSSPTSLTFDQNDLETVPNFIDVEILKIFLFFLALSIVHFVNNNNQGVKCIHTINKNLFTNTHLYLQEDDFFIIIIILL